MALRQAVLATMPQFTSPIVADVPMTANADVAPAPMALWMSVLIALITIADGLFNALTSLKLVFFR